MNIKTAEISKEKKAKQKDKGFYSRRDKKTGRSIQEIQYPYNTNFKKRKQRDKKKLLKEEYKKKNFQNSRYVSSLERLIEELSTIN